MNRAARASRADRVLPSLTVSMLAFAFLACARPAEKSEADAQAAQSSSALGHYLIRPQDLPPPNEKEDSDNPPNVVAQPAGAKLNLPPGFDISVYAEGDFQMPRAMALAPNADVFLSDSQANKVFVLRDTNNDGKADQRFVFASDLNLPYGIGFWKDYVYIGNTDEVIRYKYQPGQTKAEGKPEKIASLPGRGYFQHWTRNIRFSPDGAKMYVSVGSESNVDVEDDPRRAAISEYNPDGTGHRIYAGGTRNAIGLGFYPGTSTLWAAVQERDRLGDDLVPDYVTHIEPGGFYGWPFAYIGPNEDPRRKGERPGLVQRTIVPDVLIQAHSAVLGLMFYQGKMFPEEYRGDAFVALHGSWNRSKRTGYKIIRIRFKDGKPVGGYEDFLTGWSLDPKAQNVWGRPVELLELSDGSLLVSDDGGKNIWRVAYHAPGAAAAK